MNIFRREMRAHRNGLTGWSIAMVLLVVSGMAKFSVLGIGGQSANELFKAFPRPVQAILGVQGLNLTTVIGYFGVLYLYMQLTVAVHAAMLGAEIISKEERDKTSEFLFQKPVTRARVITQKLLAGFVNIVILNLVSTIISVLIVAIFAKNYSNDTLIIILMAGLFVTQLLFFSLGASLAGYFKNPKLPPIIATAILLATYIIWVVIDLSSKLELLKYVTPFKYFDASAIIKTGYLNPFYVGLSVVIIIVFIAMTYLTFNKRDLKV